MKLIRKRFRVLTPVFMAFGLSVIATAVLAADSSESTAPSQRVVVDGQEGIMLTGFHPILTERPRLIVRDEDRAAKSVRLYPEKKDRTYDELVAALEPYIEQHLADPDYLMSRMPMHWGAGKHYTHFPPYSEKAAEPAEFDSPHEPAIPQELSYGRLDVRNRSGNAPVPTVRVGFTKGRPRADIRVNRLKLGEMSAYNGELFAMTDRSDGSVKHWLPLSGEEVEHYLTGVAQLACNASLVYFWSGDERYAKFACDYLMQFALGIYFQEPFNTTGTATSETGLNGQDIAASFTKTYAYVYDNCYDYLQKNQDRYLSGDFYPHREGEVDKVALKEALEGKTIEDVVDRAFFKFAYDFILLRMLVGDLEHPNNHCIWSQQCVDFLLAIEDDELRARGIDVIAYSDETCVLKKTRWGREAYFGSFPIDLQVKNGYTDDGIWKESATYSQIAKGRIVNLLRTLDRHGYDSWQRNSAALKSAAADFRMIFPNRMLVGFGNSGAWEVKQSNLTEMYRVAKRNGMGQAELDEMANSVRWAIDYGLCEPLGPEEMEALPSAASEILPRTDLVDFVPFYLQRNGAMDRENGLMSTMYGGKYTHHQAEGINFELYGKGFKLLPHNGYGGYGTKIHREYNERIGCKNTVIPGGIPMTLKDLDTGRYDLQLYAMEPLPTHEAVSPSFSFIETGIPYGGQQRRNMALIRTSRTSGFYLDIFRSSNADSNEYRLHGIGQKLSVFSDGASVPMEDDPGHRDERLGDQYLKDRQMSVDTVDGNIRALFEIYDEPRGRHLELNVYMLGREDYRVYTSTGHPRESAEKPFSHMRSRAFFVDQPGEAWDRPFVSVFEPSDQGDSRVRSLKRLSDGEFTSLQLHHGDVKYNFYSHESPETANTQSGVTFRGTFAAISQGEDTRELYLGQGVMIESPDGSIKSLDGQEFSGSVRITEDQVLVSTTAKCEVSVNGKTRIFDEGMNQPFD